MNIVVDDTRAGTLIETVFIDRLVRPFHWVSWTNPTLILLAVFLPIEAVSLALRGEVTFGSILLCLPLVFPGWIAWKNVDVVSSLNRRSTIPSLLSIGIPASLALAGLLLKQRHEAGGPDSPELRAILTVCAVFPLLAAAAVWRLRRRTVLPFGINLRDLLAAALRQGAPSGQYIFRPQRPWRGCTWIVAAILIMIGKDYIPTDWLAGLGSSVRPDERTLVGFCLVLVLFARYDFRPTANAVLETDRRKPVLLLRSFSDDERDVNPNSDRTLFDPSLEDRLIGAFAHYGPFIAVGAPAERMQLPGAARMLLSDADWQNQVIRWIDNSRLILMMAGVTHWVGWELKQVIDHDAVGRLVICFPPVTRRNLWKWSFGFGANMETRLVGLRQAFVDTRWSAALTGLDDAKTLRSVFLHENGGVTIVRARSRNRNAYHVAILIAAWVSHVSGSETTTGAESTTLPSNRSSSADLWFASVPLLIGGVFLLVKGCDARLRAELMPAAIGLLVAGVVSSPALPQRARYIVSEGRGRWISYGGAVALICYGALVAFAAVYGESIFGKDDGRRDAESFRWLMFSAHAGLPEAEYAVGTAYLYGKGVGQDKKRGFDWTLLAATQGDANAMARLGDIYLNGEGVNAAPAQASAWYKQAASAGHNGAKFMLGKLYENGIGVPPDLATAVQYYREAAAAGDAFAITRLGEFFLYGKGVPRDFKQARALVKDAIGRGFVAANFDLALMNENGWGMERNLNEAARLYAIAGDSGLDIAKLQLGALLYNGNGITRDRTRARQLFADAAKSQDPKIRSLAEADLRLPQ